ncbi:MAG: SGNH/GDSL hydrolase family protein [Blautia sp.]|nr:SGNH/GDSL hydrolase family protein [Blautia sp.]
MKQTILLKYARIMISAFLVLTAGISVFAETQPDNGESTEEIVTADNAACRFQLKARSLKSNILWDSTYVLDFLMYDGSTLTGAVLLDNAIYGNGKTGYVDLSISADSSWIVTGNSILRSLYNEGTIVDTEGRNVRIKNADGTIYVEGDSEYVITVNNYETTADLPDPEEEDTNNNMNTEEKLRLLFIGNSHTYYNDLPKYVAKLAGKYGIDCDARMIAFSGWSLSQHVLWPAAKFNLKYGDYDYVILQEHSHPFAPKENYYKAVQKLDQWIKKTGGKTVIYETWAKKAEPEKQAAMNTIHQTAAEKLGAILAPVGEYWWAYQKKHPDVELYTTDGAHASPAGTKLAAKVIWKSIYKDIIKDTLR